MKLFYEYFYYKKNEKSLQIIAEKINIKHCLLLVQNYAAQIMKE